MTPPEMSEKYIACPQCGQNMNLSPNAEDELSDLKSDLRESAAKVERYRSALERIHIRTFLDAEGPELRRQNENNFRDAHDALSEGEK